MITIRVFGQSLRASVEDPEIQCEVSSPMSVRDLFQAHQERLGGLLPFLTKGELMVTINQRVSTLDSVVRDGDVVKLTHQFNPSYDGGLWQNP